MAESERQDPHNTSQVKLDSLDRSSQIDEPIVGAIQEITHRDGSAFQDREPAQQHLTHVELSLSQDTAQQSLNTPQLPQDFPQESHDTL